jgi:hypothetical protein
MAIQARHRTSRKEGQALDLPPPFSLVRLREVGDAFEHACRNAAALGAGTLVYVGRFDLAEFAVVLEPEESLAEARHAFYAGMVALCDALITHAPPERPIAFDWPDAMRVDGGLVGGGRLGWPDEAAENEPPAWLVFAGMIRTVSMGETQPGLIPLGTALDVEGFDGLDSGRLVESFARHLMRALDDLRERGFEALAKSYLSHLAIGPGALAQIDARGDLLIKRGGGEAVERRRLVEALATPSWLDPETKGPRN